MDEPFSNLDRGLRDSVRDETLALLRGLDTTVIMVTHDPEEALSAGDRVVLMQEGRIVQSGSGYDLHDRPNCRYAADFFCAFNRIDGVIRNGRIETAIGSFESNAAIPDGSAALAYIRQSAITLTEDKGEGGHGIRGQISSRIFLGEIEQFGVSVPGVRDDVRIRSMQRTSFATPSVRLTVNPKGVLVFA
jgi:iron(III) transport system ATP-binding protein